MKELTMKEKFQSLSKESQEAVVKQMKKHLMKKELTKRLLNQKDSQSLTSTKKV